MADRSRFFVQEYPREAWHVENTDDSETMLCGRIIPVDSEAKLRHTWGPRKCSSCWIILKRDEALASTVAEARPARRL